MKQLLNPTTLAGALIWGVAAVLTAIALSRITTWIVRKSSWGRNKLSRKVDRTLLLYVLRLKAVLIFLVVALAYAAAIPGLRAIFGTLLASAGVAALVLGLAAKSTLANLISGMALAAYRPFRIGDKVLIEDEYGEIEDITLRHTVVLTWERKRLIIPNERIDNMSIVNYSIRDPGMLCPVEVRVSYDTDLDHAFRVMKDEAMKCPHRDPAAEEPWTRVVAHEEFGVSIRIYMWVPNVDASWQGRFWLLEHVRKRCALEDIEIPVPYRMIMYKKDTPATGE
jgi:small-conductance mechanosensitive channel